MREYAKVYTAFWTDTTTRAMSEDARTLALYLLTCPHGNLIGLFRLSNAYAADDLKWSLERVSKGFEELFEKGFCARDSASDWLVILKYLRWNQFENPNVAKSAAKIFDVAPACEPKSLCAQAILKYGAFLSEQFRNSLETVSTTLPEPSRNPEPSLAKPEPSQDPSSSADAPDPVAVIFERWKEVMKHPKGQLTPERRKKIRTALKHYSLDECLTAITGCSVTPHNMGNNDSGERYDDIELILRDAKHIDRFIRNAANPPKPRPVVVSGRSEPPTNPLRDTSKDYSGVKTSTPETAHAVVSAARNKLTGGGA